MTEEAPEPAKTPKPKCGVVMPISSIGDCSEAHWADVRSILYDAIEDAAFEPNLVSDADDIGVIQKRIVQNLYDNPIVVCDVSAKNPNVMFELGMRLAFDKATVIVKDDETSYSFDTSPIEHLTYPRDLRFTQITEFKAELTKKLEQTHKAASKDPEFSTFLKHFGTFSVAKLDSKEVSGDELIIEELRELRSYVKHLALDDRPRRPRLKRSDDFAERVLQTIRRHCDKNGLTRKAQIRKAKQEIRDEAERFAPEYFPGPEDFHEAFDRIWGPIYD